MYCYLGTEKPNLTVTSQTFRRIADALVGTEGDNNGMVNIPSFGVCKCSSPNLLVFPSHKAGSKQNRKTVSMG